MRLASTLAAAAFACALPAGADEAHIWIPAPLAALVEVGERSGLLVGLEAGRDGGVLATVSLMVRPLPGSPAYPLDDLGSCPETSALDVTGALALPRGLLRDDLIGLPALEVVERVVTFVSRRIVLNENDSGAQDAISVLRRGRGRCSGRANLAVAALRGLGIPARVAHGLLIADSGARWHRWGEAWLGRAGWVAFDPGASVGLVSARYLPLRGASAGRDLAGVRLEHLDEQGYLRLPRRGGLRVVPAGAATLRCVAPVPEIVMTAVLLGPGGLRLARTSQGSVTFTDLLPGRYRLLWHAGRREGTPVPLELAGSREIYLSWRSGGSGT